MRDFGWSRVENMHVLRAAMGCARGCYQENILRGNEAISGSSLRGKAARYSAHYRASSTNLIDHMRARGFAVRVKRGAHGKHILVVESRVPNYSYVLEAIGLGGVP